MTSGIYKLKFEGTSKVYIGQSVNIEKRFKDHIRSLKNRTSAKKLLSGFDTFGYPSIVILEECKDKDLMSLLENSYIQTYESFVSGFNSLEHAEDTPISFVGGCEASAAIYSKKQITEVFFMLCDTTMTAEKISTATKVAVGVIYYISEGKGHKWLEIEYPIQYNTYIVNRGHGNSAQAKGIKYPHIKDPNGIVHTITNRSRFATENYLDCGALGRVLRGVAKSHKGWKLA